MNLWKDIPPGDNPPLILNAVIEVISGSRDKYEYKQEWEAFVLDRVIPSSVIFNELVKESLLFITSESFKSKIFPFKSSITLSFI